MSTPKLATTPAASTATPAHPTRRQRAPPPLHSGQAKLAPPTTPPGRSARPASSAELPSSCWPSWPASPTSASSRFSSPQETQPELRQDLIDSEALFRSGIAGLIVVVILDIVVACSLLAVFESVNRSVAIMAAVFRIAYSTVFLVAISQLVSALALLGDADQALRAVGQFHTIWDASYALFGVHLALIGYLVYRSGFAPRIIGVLLVLAGLGYLVDEIGSVLVSGYSLEISRFSFVGEAVLIFWLLIKGVRLHGSETQRTQ